MKEIRLLFAAAEIFPFAKSGGLGDIAFALPKALRKKISTTAIMPLYGFIDRERYGIAPTGEHFTVTLDGSAHDIEFFHAQYDGMDIFFVYNDTLCDREYIYGPPGEGYGDNDLRFAIFGHSIAEAVERFDFNMLHLNDWHTALAAVIARDKGVKHPIVYTIHNLVYQGVFDARFMKRWGVGDTHFHIDDMEYYGYLNWMKGAIAHADIVTTVSPSYAIEIQLPEFGFGLDGFLRKHSDKLVGILNGIDYDIFDPMRDPSLDASFGPSSIRGKKRCKNAFLKEASLKEKEWPLISFIGRFSEQKGLDILIDSIGELLGNEINLAILGDGESRYIEALKEIEAENENFYLQIGYDESLSHRIYAASDFFLMPSIFEPCGLAQMIAMRYGAIPVVHAVGGLRDTVHPICRTRKICGEGFVFESMDSKSFLAAISEALKLYKKRSSLQKVRRFDMECDFSIEKCAKKYLDLYEGLR